MAKKSTKVSSGTGTAHYNAPARKGLQMESGGKQSAGGKFITHRQKYRQIREGLGLAGG